MAANTLLARLGSSLRTVPRAAGWRDTVLVAAVLAPLFGLLIVASERMSWQPTFDAATLRLAVIAIFAPAMGEELLFRAAWFPQPVASEPVPLRAWLLSTLAFVLWHPLQALLFGGARGLIFLDPFFLLAVALLGLGCGWLYWRTLSVWPPIVLHWLTVVGWKALAGGPPLV